MLKVLTFEINSQIISAVQKNKHNFSSLKFATDTVEQSRGDVQLKAFELIRNERLCNRQVSEWIELFTEEKLNNKQRKIMLTVWRGKTVMERAQRGEIHICQEHSVLVAICCRIPRVARQLCVRLSVRTD